MEDLRQVLDPWDFYGPDFRAKPFRLLQESESQKYGRISDEEDDIGGVGTEDQVAFETFRMFQTVFTYCLRGPVSYMNAGRQLSPPCFVSLRPRICVDRKLGKV